MWVNDMFLPRMTWFSRLGCSFRPRSGRGSDTRTETQVFAAYVHGVDDYNCSAGAGANRRGACATASG
jgi:hypothetical protein